ncbi:thrombospondin-1-like [Mercenaria mercenaria]|uniref:thrombospondin-1-like n=1 Tax=Mercenaria mercenaria TaxID=6596 RepID=UPI00234E49D9|nr:thrombospondin-1-like [Mercenaria mercenaria]
MQKLPNRTMGMSMAGSQTQYCYECCSTENCNRNLCDHTHQSSCVDDESFDCALLNSMLSLCKNIVKAKRICPKYCDLCHVVDGNWSPWTSWSGCDVTCENGTRSRARTCTNPAPQYGGLNCSGDSTEFKLCRKQLCPGKRKKHN